MSEANLGADENEIVHNGVRVVEVLQDPIDLAVKIINDARELSRPSLETGRYIQTSDRGGQEDVVCLSTQIGCGMECSFCASTLPFVYREGEHPKRLFGSLTSEEIVGQAQNALTVMPAEQEDGVVFSYMGMGEPLANIEAVKEAIRTLGNTYPNSRSTLCTMLPIGFGAREAKRLADEVAAGVYPHPVKLHISLHASEDGQRSTLLPKAEPIETAIEVGKYYMERTGQAVKMNYVLVGGFNDGSEDIERLGRILKGTGLTLKISDLNPYNSPRRVPAERAKEFQAAIEAFGIKTSRFTSDGPIIESGCGQLTKNDPILLRNIGDRAITFIAKN